MSCGFFHGWQIIQLSHCIAVPVCLSAHLLNWPLSCLQVNRFWRFWMALELTLGTGACTHSRFQIIWVDILEEQLLSRISGLCLAFQECFEVAVSLSLLISNENSYPYVSVWTVRFGGLCHTKRYVAWERNWGSWWGKVSLVKGCGTTHCLKSDSEQLCNTYGAAITIKEFFF